MASRCLSRTRCLRSSLVTQQPTILHHVGAAQHRTISLFLRNQTQALAPSSPLSNMPSRRNNASRGTSRNAPLNAANLAVGRAATFSTSASVEMASVAVGRAATFSTSASVEMASVAVGRAATFSTSASVEMASVAGSDAEAPRVPYSQMEGRLHPSLLAALGDMGYTHMSPVQEKVLDGKLLKDLSHDAIVQAKTGTGKTTAFLLPTLQTLLQSRNSLPRGQVGVLILSPTRDLAMQIAKECDQLTARTQPRIECHLAYGGSNKDSNLRKFMQGNPSVLVATPGRLGDYLTDSNVRDKFRNMRALVLDEADTMLDSGFLNDLLRILQALPPKERAGWQGLLYSATMPPKMKEVVHYVVRPNCVHISTISKDDVPTVDSIPQSLYTVDSAHDLFPTVQALLRSEHAVDKDKFKAVVFTHTARNAGLLYSIFSDSSTLPPGLLVHQMQSRMSQGARDRTVREFKAAKAGVLFASDVVGRGMDFPDVSLVVQIGLPQTSEQYVHRVGRTGRAGKSGRAAMVLSRDEMTWAEKHKHYPMVRRNINDLDVAVEDCRASTTNAIATIPELLKTQSYVALLGYLKSNTKYIIKDPVAMVQAANEFASVLGFDEPPALEPKTVGMMGLKGVPGLRVASRGPAGSGGRGGFGGGRRGDDGGRRQASRAGAPY